MFCTGGNGSCDIYQCCPEGKEELLHAGGMSLSEIQNNKADCVYRSDPTGVRELQK